MPVDNQELLKFRKMAKEFRKEILETLANAGSGHPGGSLSLVEILISLYFYKMNYDPKNPSKEDRDRLILSKGHASPVLYVTLANAGFFPKEELKSFRKLGARLQGHIYPTVPGVELATGYLGQGLSAANGLALGLRMRGLESRVYCILGDGEIQEGQVWEAAMTAPHYKIDNLTAIIDANGVQENGPVVKIKNEEPLAEKWRSFGWYVREIDGHSFEEIIPALDDTSRNTGIPSVIIARTVKGKGVSFMEGNHQWHGKAPKKEDLEKALAELEAGL